MARYGNSISKYFTNSLVDRGAHQVPGEECNQDDCEADESSVDDQDGVLIGCLDHAVVMHDHANDRENL